MKEAFFTVPQVASWLGTSLAVGACIKTVGKQNMVNLPLWRFEYIYICPGLAVRLISLLNFWNTYKEVPLKRRHHRNHSFALTDSLKVLVAGNKSERHKGRI